MRSFKEFLEHTDLEPNELTTGCRVQNNNRECKHYRSTGIVKRILKLIDTENPDNVIGNEVEYECDCDGPTWKKGDLLKKTEIQLRKI